MKQQDPPIESPVDPITHTLKIRTNAVTRLLTGEDVHLLAEELNVRPRQLESWAKEFCRAGEMRLRLLPDNWFEHWLSIAEKLVPIATLISVLLAVTLFVQGQRKELAQNARAAAMERESRVRDAYTALDDKYLEYLKSCLEHPDLDVADTPRDYPAAQSARAHREESIMLSMLLSILERAFLMFNTPSDGFEKNQWNAWAIYMTSWASRENFRAEWAQSRTQFDANFTRYLDGVIRNTPVIEPQRE